MVERLSELEKVTPPVWQANIWQRWSEQIEHNTLPHALLLAGRAGLGKTRLAVSLAHRLLCEQPTETACGQCKACHLLQAGSHPDLKLLEPEETGKQLKIDPIRELVDFRSKAAQFGGYRVAILAPAEAMNLNAANALLKTLEEPGEKMVILLVTDQLSALLPTIRSRAQLVNCEQFDRRQALEWLKLQVGGDADKASQWLAVANGAPLLARDMLDSEWAGQRSAFCRQWLDITLGRASVLTIIEQWQEVPQTILLDWLFSWSLDLLKLKGFQQSPNNADDATAMLANPDLLALMKPALPAIPVEGLCRFVDALAQLRQDMLFSTANLNQQLQWENLLIDWMLSSRHS